MRVTQLVVVALFTVVHLTRGCEEFILKPKDGSVIIGRSLEFYLFPLTNMVSEPAGTPHRGRIPVETCKQTTETLEWENKYKVLKQLEHKEMQIGCVDAMNSNGLSVSGLYLSLQHSVYPNLTDCSNAISQFQVAEYIVGNYGDATTVENDIKSGNFPSIWAELYLEEPLQLHWSITDSTGKSIIFEYRIDGSRQVYHNTYGVITNDPNYDWHMVNIKRYMQPSTTTTSRQQKQQQKQGHSHSDGLSWAALLGLPGDYSSPSRLLRAVYMSHYSEQKSTAIEGVNQAFHILNVLDIPQGSMAQEKHPNDYTYWSIVKDLTNKCEYYRDYQDLSIRRICLDGIPATPAQVKMERQFMDGVVDATSELKPIEE